MIETEELVRRLDKRPGFKVVSYCDVGLPIFQVTPLITLREPSPIGVIEEFVLKSIDSKVSKPDAISQFLGIPQGIVETQIGSLLYESVVRRDSTTGIYLLTAKGMARLSDLNSTRVVKKEFRLNVDGLTRQIIPIDQSDLYSERQLEAFVIPGMLPVPRKAPRAREISVSDVNRLFASYARNEQQGLQAVKVDAYVKRASLLFRRAIALAFKPENGRGMSISFAIDGRISTEHEVAFSVSGADQRSGLFKDLFDPSKRRSEIALARKHIQEFVPNVLSASPEKVPKAGTLSLKPKLVPDQGAAKPLLVRTLSSYEHAPMLHAAFESATSRILIVSPWIRRQVVNQEFVQRLKACIERGVEVTIAFGFGRVDKGERVEDAAAKSELEELSRSAKGFNFLRKSNIHAKILLVDDKYFITTSFNWLSFRGDRRQPLREEEGTYVEGVELVNEYFDRLRSRLAAP